MVQQSANLGAFISSLYSEDFDLMSRSVVDEVVEPDRSMLIPEFESIKKISIESGLCLVVFLVQALLYLPYQTIVKLPKLFLIIYVVI